MPRHTTPAATLTVADYARAFRLVDRCVDAASVESLREELLEGLGSVYGIVDSAFFCATTFTSTAADPDPVLNGRTAAIIDEYRERWWRSDVMFVADSLAGIRRCGVSALSRLDPQHLSGPARSYVTDFLLREGVRFVCALDLDLADGRRGVVGLFSERPEHLDDGDLAGLELVVRQISAVSRRLPLRDRPATALDGLTPRLREIALLVGEGCTNAAIARRTFLSVDTVKKYVTQALARTGCRNRTELALLCRTSTARTPVDPPGCPGTDLPAARHAPSAR